MKKIETLKPYKMNTQPITMCDILKPILKHTILPEDVVRVIAEFTSVKERFHIKSEMWRLFNNPCPSLNDESEDYDIDNKINRYRYAIYYDLIDLTPCSNYVTLSSIDTSWLNEWEDTLGYNLNELMDTNSNELAYDEYMLVKSFERALGLNFSYSVGALISKSRYKRIDWAKFILNHKARFDCWLRQITDIEEDIQELYPDSDDEFDEINLIVTSI